MSESRPTSVLISGGGIAGPTLAFWLHHRAAPGRDSNYSCTIVERSPVPRTTGQQIDVRGAAWEVVRRMGLEDSVRAATVKEHGVAFIDSAGKHLAEFASKEGEDGGKGFTADVEILRGEMARVFFEATKEQAVEYIWDNSIAGFSEVDDGVVVRFAKELKDGGWEGEAWERKFDLVIVADGMNSRTRRLVFEEEDQAALKDLGQHMAYFTIPPSDRDTRWATWYNAPGGRLVFLRPDLERNRTGAYLAVCGSDVPRNYLALSVPEQMRMWDGLFADAGGDAPRVLQGMHACHDFYMQQIAQTRLPRWTSGRVALLGDAAYCPSPISGQGASCAVIGAYVLAGELRKHAAGDHAAAFARYEDIMRPVVDKAQKLIPGAPAIANPQTPWGIAILNGFLGAISWSGLANWFQGSILTEIVDLPQYEM